MVEKCDRILVVDDIPCLAELVANILDEAGFKNFQTYSDPFEVLDDIKDVESSSFIITDFQMPGINGVELLHAAQQHNRKINGVIISAQPEKAAELNSGYHIVEKGSDFQELLLTYITKKSDLQSIITTS